MRLSIPASILMLAVPAQAQFWSEVRKLTFFDDDAFGMAKAHERLKAGDLRGALRQSERRPEHRVEPARPEAHALPGAPRADSGQGQLRGAPAEAPGSLPEGPAR